MPEPPAARATRSLLFTSGKGGVGTSNLVLNLAIALGEMGERVMRGGRRHRPGEPRSAVRVDGAIRPGRRARGPLPPLRCDRDGPRRDPDRARVHAIGPGSTISEKGQRVWRAELGELESEADFVLIDAGSGLGPV